MGSLQTQTLLNCTVMVQCNNRNQSQDLSYSIERIMDICQEMQEPEHCVGPRAIEGPPWEKAGTGRLRRDAWLA